MRPRRGGRLLIAVGILIALLAALAAFALLQRPSAPAEKPVLMKKVLVASEDVPVGHLIDPLAVELMDRPTDSTPFDAVASLSGLAGQYTRAPIFAGQVVQASMLSSAKELADTGELASALIPIGLVAFPCPVSELSGVAYALNSGDRVDVLITFRFVEVDRTLQVQLPLKQNLPGDVEGKQHPRLVSQLTLQNVGILKVGSWYTPPESPQQDTGEQTRQSTLAPSPSVVTLLVTQQDALVLQYARKAGATVEFALRNPNDAEQVDTEPVNLNYMMTRFGISVPALGDQSLQTLMPEE